MVVLLEIERGASFRRRAFAHPEMFGSCRPGPARAKNLIVGLFAVARCRRATDARAHAGRLDDAGSKRANSAPDPLHHR